MIILYSPYFKKKFQKLPLKIKDKFAERLEIFINNPSSKILRNHKLSGSLEGYNSFSITGNYRAIYRRFGDHAIKLVNIGTHNQVY